MKKAILILLGLAVGLLISEVIIRFIGHKPFFVHDIKLAFIPKPYADIDSILCYNSVPGKYEVNYNDQILSTYHILEDKSRATRLVYDSLSQSLSSIHLYGCSYTFGTNLSDSMTMAWKVQSTFENKYDVKNFGIGGFGVGQIYFQIAEMIQARKKLPALIIINYAAFHDKRNVNARVRRKELVPYFKDMKKAGQMRWPKFSLKKDTLHLDYVKLEYRLWPLQKQSALVHLLENTYNEWSRNKEEEERISYLLLSEINKIAEENGIKCLIAGINTSEDTKNMLSILNQNGIETLDISIDLNIKGNNMMPYDAHPSGQANSQYAEKLVQYTRLKLE